MIAVLWLIGPAGVGKTSAAWQIHSRLVETGVRSAYVDIDQLGICSPAPSDDPDRYGIKARNLRAVVGGFHAAGAECVVVSGVVDPAVGVPREGLDGLAVTACRLHADSEELARRYVQRMRTTEGLDDTLAEAAQYDALDGPVVDTTGLSVAEVVQRVQELAGGWRAEPGPPAPVEVGDGAGRILWLCGATGVGKSTVGFPLFFSARPASYVDLDQIGFYTPGGHTMRARNLAAVWDTFRSAGARAMVVVGPVEDDAAFQLYADALPAATFTLCRLYADREELTNRIRLRANAFGSWSQPGDPLLGLSEPDVLRIADRAVLSTDALERAGLGIRVDTSGRTAEEVVEQVVAATGWPR